uniref:Host-inducible protein A n=1 Tax=Rhizobium fredii TaxID=380 RepID=HIA_RHIFR|nr:RecName: Full=Host-inducible protein A [Sinorhizobium fredii]AAA26294.1 inducible protein A [Sinorhizobium fredii]
MHLDRSDSNGGSSRYTLDHEPPVVPIDLKTFRREIRKFHGKEITDIADNPQEYSDFVSAKARRTADVAQQYGIRRDSENARYFSYQLGNQCVGLMRTEGGFSMEEEFESKSWRDQFPGHQEITSTVDLQVAHPLVENAGDILLEAPTSEGRRTTVAELARGKPRGESRAAMMGFVEVDDCDMVLDPKQHPDKWTQTSAAEWRRKDKPPLYLRKFEDAETAQCSTKAALTRLTKMTSCDRILARFGRDGRAPSAKTGPHVMDRERKSVTNCHALTAIPIRCLGAKELERRVSLRPS